MNAGDEEYFIKTDNANSQITMSKQSDFCITMYDKYLEYQGQSYYILRYDTIPMGRSLS